MNPVFPSILSTNFFDLEAKLRQFEKSGIEFIHLDVMDGHFVDQISFGPSLARISPRSPAVSAAASAWNESQSAPAAMKCGIAFSGLLTIRWASMAKGNFSLMARASDGPKEI